VYIVREKNTRKILHVNPAPVSQQLEGADIYFQLDPATMEVGEGDLAAVPEHFDIDERGQIMPWTLERQIKQGIRALPPELKAVGDRIVEKSLAEKIADGVVKMKPTEKLVGEHIEQKTVAEQVADGLIKLSPTQVVEEDDIREMTEGEKAAAGLIHLDPTLKVVGKAIVPKTRAELARDRLIELAPDEGVKGDEIVKLTPREMLKEGRLDLQRYKAAAIERHAQACLAARRKVVPDHELLYAAIGALEPSRVEKYRSIVSTFVKALDRATQAIQKASSADEVDAVPAAYESP
jgi:hypothetical protein